MPLRGHRVLDGLSDHFRKKCAKDTNSKYRIIVQFFEGLAERLVPTVIVGAL